MNISLEAKRTYSLIYQQKRIPMIVLRWTGFETNICEYLAESFGHQDSLKTYPSKESLDDFVGKLSILEAFSIHKYS